MQPAMSCAILFLVQNLMQGNKNLLAVNSNEGEIFKNDEDTHKKKVFFLATFLYYFVGYVDFVE